MVKHCPQLGSTWPRSVHFWKIKLTYFPVICQYLTLIWQQKKAFGTDSSAHSGVCFLSASSDDSFLRSYPLFFAYAGLKTDFNVDVKTTCCHNNFQMHLKNSCSLMKSAALASLEVLLFLFALTTVTRPILGLSIIYIKNDMRIICQFISITISDMLNVQRCWLWQFRTCGADGKQAWSRLSIAIIKYYWTQHLLTLQRSQLFPLVRKMGTV